MEKTYYTNWQATDFAKLNYIRLVGPGEKGGDVPYAVLLPHSIESLFASHPEVNTEFIFELDYQATSDYENSGYYFILPSAWTDGDPQYVLWFGKSPVPLNIACRYREKIYSEDFGSSNTNRLILATWQENINNDWRAFQLRSTATIDYEKAKKPTKIITAVKRVSVENDLYDIAASATVDGVDVTPENNYLSNKALTFKNWRFAVYGAIPTNFFSLKIKMRYQGQETLIAQYTPMLNKLNNRVGLYDEVTNTPYYLILNPSGNIRYIHYVDNYIVDPSEIAENNWK